MIQDYLILEEARKTIEQWDKHDKFRETEADKSLYTHLNEPPDVAIARLLLTYDAGLTKLENMLGV